MRQLAGGDGTRAARPPERGIGALERDAGADARSLRFARHGPQAPQPRADRGTRARRRPRLPEGHRLRRRGADQADHRRRQHVDRDDAVQLPPARARRQGQGGDPRGRRHADGAQHDRDLGRDHDGHRGDEGVAGQPRGDRRLDRAGRRRSRVRRGDRDQRLRQDDPRHRDGAVPAERAEPDALRRLDLPGSVPRPADHDPGGVRGGRRARRRPDHRRGADRDRGGRLARRRRLRRPVHRQHDGDGVRGARDLPVLLGGPGRGPAQGRGGQGGRPAGDGRAQARASGRATSSPARRSRTRSPRSRAAAARPTACCTCWRSPTRSASSCRSTTSTGSASARRCCATSSPAASTSPPTCTRPAASRSCSSG